MAPRAKVKSPPHPNNGGETSSSHDPGRPARGEPNLRRVRRIARSTASRQAAKDVLHGILQRFGVDVVRYSAANFAGLMRAQIMERHGITLVLDVGANAGQYAHGLRADGYEGRIVSFEPLSEPFAQLHRSTAADHSGSAVGWR